MGLHFEEGNPHLHSKSRDLMFDSDTIVAIMAFHVTVESHPIDAGMTPATESTAQKKSLRPKERRMCDAPFTFGTCTASLRRYIEVQMK